MLALGSNRECGSTMPPIDHAWQRDRGFHWLGSKDGCDRGCPACAWSAASSGWDLSDYVLSFWM